MAIWHDVREGLVLKKGNGEEKVTPRRIINYCWRVSLSTDILMLMEIIEGQDVKDEARREYQRTYKRNLYNELRRQVLDCYGNVCGRCGFDDVRALQIDHVAGRSADDNFSRNVYRFYRAIINVTKRRGFPPKRYQCLCANCNWIKKVENDEVRSVGR